MIKDALLAYAHYISMFVLVSILVGELFLFRKDLPMVNLRRLASIDLWYGIVAALVVATGLGRVFLGTKGPDFYAHNHVFWTKMALFVIVAVLSIVPTIAFIKWNRRAPAGDTFAFADGEYTRISRILWLEIGGLILIPLCATFMARGL